MKKFLIVIAGSMLAGALLAMGITDEVKIGGVQGKVVMRENGQPLSDVLVVLTRAEDEKTFTDRNWSARTKPDGTFSIRNIPAGDYDLEADAKEHSLEDSRVTVAEGASTLVAVTLKPNDPRLSLDTGRRVLAPGEPIKIDVEGFVPNITELKLAIYRISLARIASEGGLRAALSPISESRDAKLYANLGKIVWTDTQQIKRTDVEGAFVGPLKLPTLPEGLYVVHCRGGKLDADSFLNISHIALVAKTWDKGAVCYVTDIRTGSPIANATLLRKSNKSTTECGHTDAKGLAKLGGSSEKGQDVLFAQMGDSVAACDFEGRNEDGNGDDDNSDPNTRVFSYADRPIYKPGDTVLFKAIVRHLDGDRLVLPKISPATVKIFDPQENLLETQHVSMSSHGTLHGSFTSSTEAAPGVYRIDIQADGGKDSYYANLAAYRKPDFSIKVTPSAPMFVSGDQASATVECQYFFGGPVVGAKVSATVFRNPHWEDFEDEEENGNSGNEEDSGDGDFHGGEYVREVEGTTDGTGKAILKFSTSLDPESAGANVTSPRLWDYDYSMQVRVEESDTASFEGSGSFLVTRGDFRVSASTDPFIATVGQRANLTVSATTYDKQPKPVSGQQFNITIGQETYTKHTVVYEPLKQLTAVTDSSGKATVPVDVGHAENLKIEVSGKDQHGRAIQTRTYLYVEGSPFYSDQSSSKLTVKLDKKTYHSGDTAKVLVATNSPGGQALMTVQAEGVLHYQLLDLSKGSSIVHLPVDDSMTPNVFVSVAYVHDRNFVETERKLTCVRVDRKLNIELTPSTAKALPGSTVSIRVRTTDSGGRGVPANLSVGVVDESIYALRKDTTDIVSGLYPERQDLVQTAYSFPDIYLDGGDKAGGNVAIRRKFRDTAQWTPEVQTDGNGDAVCEVTLPDNLTSWRATAVGATDDTVVGMGTTNIRASKPLMVRLLTPQFLVATDQQEMTASITNDSGGAIDLDFRIRSTGVQIADSGTKRLHLDQAQTMDLPLEVQAAAVSGQADMVAEVRAEEGQTDAVDGTFPILPHGRLVTDHASGILNGSGKVELNALPNRDTGSGGLDVVVTPGVATAMLQSIDQLVQYPYGCVEQTMSRFLPAILVTNALKGTSFDDPKLDTRAAKIAVDGFQRLIKMQHGDGGWGWWQYDDSSVFMTGWVLDGIAQAKSIGYSPPGNLDIDKALHWAADRLEKPANDDKQELLFLAYAAAENGKLDKPKGILNGIDLRRADPGEVAVAAMLAKQVNETQMESQCIDKLRDLVERDQYFNNKRDIWTADENRALALAALSRLDPKDPAIPGLLHELNQDRGCFGWYSTRETSLALQSLCSYLKLNPQSVAPSDVTISLNGKKIRTVHVVPGSTDIPDLRLNVPIANLTPGKNELTFTAKGGAPYYSVQLRQYDVEDVLPQPLDASDIHVTRSYLRMAPMRLPDGTTSLQPDPTPVSVVHHGDIIRCEITVQCTHPVSYVMVEDPIPSNCQVTDREDVDEASDWTDWWASIVIRDDRVSLFADAMPAGTHKLTYMMRAQGLGSSTALPTYVEDMYRPSLNSSGGGSPLTVSQ